MKKVLLFLTCLFYISLIKSQTGPAGVDNTANNCFWIKADAGTSSTVNGTAISAWNDQSGNGNNLSQGTSNQQPIYTSNVINGFPAIQFDNNTNTNDKMAGADSPTLDNTAGYTFFMVSRRQIADGNARVIVSKRTGVAIDQSFMQFYYTGNTFQTDIQTNNDRYASVSTFGTNTNYLIDQLYDGTLSSEFRCKTFVAGTLDKVSSENNSFIPDNSSPIVIGSTDASDPRPFGGYIAEVIIYRKACNDPERIIVDNYLSAKYNITLSNNDKYVGDNSGNGDYDYEVAGVGKDATGSNPTFSASTCAGIGISTTGTGFDIGDYILAGHASFTNTQIFTDVGGMTGTNNSRWARIWYIDITNTSTNINTNIEFDMSDGGIGPVVAAPASNYVLLYRAGQSGNWTELTTASGISGDKVLFNGYNLVNDGYYTIGSKNASASPLPIELLNFNAIRNGSYVNINWKTASEKLNDYYTVERSSNGVIFEAVSMIKGSSNSNEVLEYAETDFNPLPGISYYRLKQTDVNGKISYSKLVAVNYHFKDSGIDIFPNPSDGDLNINFIGLENKEILVLVKDISGKECYSKIVITQTESEIHAMDLSGTLAPGTYFVVASSSNKLFSKKIVIR